MKSRSVHRIYSRQVKTYVFNLIKFLFARPNSSTVKHINVNVNKIGAFIYKFRVLYNTLHDWKNGFHPSNYTRTTSNHETETNFKDDFYSIFLIYNYGIFLIYKNCIFTTKLLSKGSNLDRDKTTIHWEKKTQFKYA